ncbi:MAG TPA: insulinase family protein [Hungateiclostridium thermocellum]|uniref:Peptidase M16 domain protein n=2 Tax=Acetivibrio thermocellus TaxID=1515 RepID=A3DCH8_ACET2|nr:pitrilysin family protein [Acetivibrio thermocellus]CDG35133.1 putative zinc protease YmxG [Acetivibrio thermocellus BC1]ABN51657.1 peptidase M16 domain protein [Acetivibrio thermocellus ATCC 27405]ADU74858.1 peptidase M16 domain protein [Acetivibrio thermocellus DSM 1313]ALX08812.1 processing peptidase [Acetivibrio thermocellus AD2]ANV76563.1 processing peptidase [Acetivibrio thermocellus DSM 2360]
MYKRIKLENGVRVVCEKIPYLRSVSIGIWVGTGSRNESQSNNGISHFIEHMLFKGTDNRSAREIADSIDSIGGQLNAFTGKECTCYYTKTLDSHADIALDVLSDMFFNSRFEEKDIEVEKKVILEEIGMYEDSPEELVHDILSETVWEDNSLGLPILGTRETLLNINKDKIKAYINERYLPQNTVIAVAGNFEEDRIIDVIKEKFGGWNASGKDSKTIEDAKFKVNSKIKVKDTEQIHICMGFEGVAHGSDELYPLLAVNNVLGGGMSSRMFQKIREEKGLVYSIYSYPSSYKNAGLFTIYAGMNAEHLEKVVELIIKEIKILLKEGLSKDELEKSKEQLKGSYILGLESTSSRMNSMGKSEVLMDRIYTPDEILKKIDAVNQESVERVIKQIFCLDKISFAIVGNIKKEIDIRKIINA